MCIKSSILSTFDEKKFLKGLWAFKFDTEKNPLLLVIYIFHVYTYVTDSHDKVIDYYNYYRLL